MKIAILVPNFSGYSGDARVAKEQISTLIENGHEISVFSLLSNLHIKGVNIYNLGMPKSLFWQRIYRLIFPLDLKTIAFWLPKLKGYDEIISHLYPMNWLAYLAKQKYGVKYVYWYHGIPNPSLYNSFIEKIYLVLFIFMTKISIRNADNVVSVSHYARKELENYTGIISSVVYNKPDPNKFYQGIDGSEIRKMLKLEHHVVFLTVGRVCHLKGMDTLIEILEKIKISIPDIKLVIVGEIVDIPYYNSLKEKGGNSVIFTGYISHGELPKYYSMCNVYVTASKMETYDLPLVEAQMCGKPVVAFDVGSHREVISNNGILIESGDLNAFTRACLRILNQNSHKSKDVL